VNNTQRETMANVVARRVTNLLNGYEFDFAQVISPQERARLPGNALNVVGAHLIPHSLIVDMVCDWLNDPVRSLPRFCAFVGALLLPPPSYCTSLTLVCYMGVDGIRAAVNVMSAIADMATRNRGHHSIVTIASTLADNLSHVHTNLRQGDRTTNTSIGSLIDARVAHSAGFDPVAWIERLYQYVRGDTRPRLSSESIYAASLIELLPVGGATTLSWDTTLAGNANDLRSSVDGSVAVRLTTTGNQILGFPAVGPVQGAFQNPFRRAAHVPVLRIPLPISWATLMLLGLVALLWYFLSMGILGSSDPGREEL
jgi:hypothetical protein